MKRFLILLLFIALFGCKKNPETFINHINGYWEIESVILPNGEKKEYTFNETIDYIEINDSLNGFRKKIKPRLDGTFSASADSETLKLVIENDSLNAYYKTLYANWKETILFADETTLKVANQDKKVYLYKRWEEINLNGKN